MHWKMCDYEKCKREINGECSHCGFHPREMGLLEVIGQKRSADDIIRKYTLPVSDEEIYARVTQR